MHEMAILLGGQAQDFSLDAFVFSVQIIDAGVCIEEIHLQRLPLAVRARGNFRRLYKGVVVNRSEKLLTLLDKQHRRET
jgi:hypothetical protein